MLANALLPGSGLAVTLVESALGKTPGTLQPADVVQAVSNPDALLKLKDLEFRHSETLVKLAYDATASLAKIQGDEAANARNLAEVEISHGNAFSAVLSALVRPSWGLVGLGVFVYSVLMKAPLDPMAHNVLDTVLKFYFGGKIVEAITPHVTEMVTRFAGKKTP